MRSEVRLNFSYGEYSRPILSRICHKGQLDKELGNPLVRPFFVTSKLTLLLAGKRSKRLHHA